MVDYPWYKMPDDGGCDYATNFYYKKAFCDYWINDYNCNTKLRLIAFSNFKVTIDGIDLQYIHEKGSGSSPQPLIIWHGWPGSIVEFLDIIEPLAHPERLGSYADDALHHRYLGLVSRVDLFGPWVQEK